MAETDVQKAQAQEPQNEPKAHNVFDIATIATLDQTVPTRWVRIAEWNNQEVCVWGTDLNAQKRINQDMRLANEGDQDQILQRRAIATIIDCCKDGDGPDAKPLFERDKHWGWVAKQPTSVIDLLVGTVQELDVSSGLRAKDILDFFAMTGALETCLTSIASHCGVSTDSLANCPETSPQERLMWQCLQIASSLGGNTPGSATTAESA